MRLFEKFFHARLALACLLAGSLFVTACTPAQENQVLADIQAVVSLSGSLLSVVQSFGALDTPQEKADILTAEQYAQDYSAAASSAVTEFDSSDAWDVKVDKITALFTAVTPVGNLPTAQINAAVQLLTAAVKLLLAQLGSVPASPAVFHENAMGSARAIALGYGTPKANSRTDLRRDAKAVPAWFAGILPGTFHHKLKALQEQADHNVALAGRLKAATRLQ